LEVLLTSERGMNACAAGFASGADVCGGEWEEQPWPHFSGNMWTATCSYIATLPPPTSLLPITHFNWGSMEAWVGSGTDVVVWHLGSAYTGHKYIQFPSNMDAALSRPSQIATCSRASPRNCRSDINIITHVYNSNSNFLHVTVRLPCACVSHVTKDGVKVFLMSNLDNNWHVDLGFIDIDRVTDEKTATICNFSRSFRMVLQMKNDMLMYMDVVVRVQYNLGAYYAGAQDSRQVMIVLRPDN